MNARKTTTAWAPFTQAALNPEIKPTNTNRYRLSPESYSDVGIVREKSCIGSPPVSVLSENQPKRARIPHEGALSEPKV